MSAKINHKYYSVFAGEWGSREALRVRRKIFHQLSAVVEFAELQKVLDVGITADKSRRENNFFENWFPCKRIITALSDQDGAWMEQDYPGLHFVQGDGRAMPFADKSFDLVFSSATLEHVGSYDNQLIFIKECCRVSRRHVFITTPNRWHPIELHTCLPMLHWLPVPIHREILKMLGLHLFAKEENLNLLDQDALKKIARTLELKKYTIFTVTFLKFTSNLLLYADVTTDTAISHIGGRKKRLSSYE
ncbi:MAG: class I SAM-dependent methyltransferase [Desulfarculales bacterium]|jgi:hypothetical protein|nr:class I SAM-dependent methyltransferase [Desulfarculales bacterium]